MNKKEFEYTCDTCEHRGICIYERRYREYHRQDQSRTLVVRLSPEAYGPFKINDFSIVIVCRRFKHDYHSGDVPGKVEE